MCIRDSAVLELVRFVRETGRTDCMMQSDGEPALVTVVEEAAKRLGVSVRRSPVESSQSQGSVERWHQTLAGQVRTLRSRLVENSGMQLKYDIPLSVWLMKHACLTLNRFLVHADNLASHERRWGKGHELLMCQFGECVNLRLRQNGGEEC